MEGVLKRERREREGEKARERENESEVEGEREIGMQMYPGRESMRSCFDDGNRYTDLHRHIDT